MSSKRPKRLKDAKRGKDSYMSVLEAHLFDAMSDISDNESVAVLNSFDQLVERFISRKQWTHLLSLFHRVDQSSQSADLGPRSNIYSKLLKRAGDTFFKLRSNMNALEFYRKSVTISNGSNLLALESFDNLLNEMIDRWHFPMMNDKSRNE